MKLFLYSCVDNENVINKTLTNEYEIDILLKSDVDISNPSIMLARVDGVEYSDYNYAHIPELNRYYILSKTTNVNNKICRLDFVCDVLETYKTDILNSNARFKRALKTGDYMDIDIDTSVIQTVSLFKSDKGLIDGEYNNVLTTIGGE